LHIKQAHQHGESHDDKNQNYNPLPTIKHIPAAKIGKLGIGIWKRKKYKDAKPKMNYK